jgi:2-polyprenyl-6-methoxyphenol hydroxylase-like FAD-dependent oxidoreductase
MNTLPVHSQVVIVGAGPSGLMMAAQLLRFGIHPLILDSKTALSTESRALAVQARSLEILRQMGLDKIAVEEGNIAKGMILHRDTEEIARIDLWNLGAGESAFPYILILEQSKTEKILLDFLTSQTCPVYWNTQLSDVHQTDKQVNLKITRNDIEEIISCDWLIAADGASSRVRKSLKIPFSGGTYEHKFFLADVKVKGGVSLDATRVFLNDGGFTGILPMKDSTYRFIGILPKALANTPQLTFDQLRPYLTFNLGFPMTEECCNWFSTYQLHHRMAERFRDQRCFLIGDAAHVHSPAGGQGMNTGLQDAYNLAWKLAGVIEEKYPLKILDTYAEERIPVAKLLLKTTDRLFSLAVGKNWFVKKIRTWVLPLVLNGFRRLPISNKRTFGMISQTAINYRQGRLSLHHSKHETIRAGDRLPYIKFFDEKLKTEIDLHDWCAHPGFTLIVIGLLSQRDILALAKWIKLSYPFNLSFYYLPFSKRNQHLFDSFEMGENHRKALIVRPDMHIGYINDVVDVELLGGYLQETIGWK